MDHLHSNLKAHRTDDEKSKVITLSKKNMNTVIKELDKATKESHDPKPVENKKSEVLIKNMSKDSDHRSNIGTSPFSQSKIEKLSR